MDMIKDSEGKKQRLHDYKLGSLLSAEVPTLPSIKEKEKDGLEIMR